MATSLASVPTFDGFLSYAHADAALAAEIARLFGPRGRIRSDARFELWDDRALLVGEAWEARISAELDRSAFGLLLLSPNFFDSSFIDDVELPAIMTTGRVVPVGLELVDLAGVDLRGVEKLQIFRLPLGARRSPGWFADLGPTNRKRFVDELIAQMARRFGPGR
ncbi:MAG: TIR domain-containing protein [Solirubrobacterales bacterium]